MRRHNIIIAILIGLLLFSGFLRDYIMQNINHVLKFLTTNSPNFSVEAFYFLENWTVEDIVALKWGLTIVFLIYFWAISYTFIRVYFINKQKAGKSITILYLAILLISGLLYGFGKISGFNEEMYPIVRTLTGLSHSFMPAMLVFLYLKYIPEQK